MPHYETPNMECAHCGNRMYVSDSRPTHFQKMQAVRRRRRCGVCKWSVTTYEVFDTALIDLEARLSAVRLTAQEAYTALGVLLAAQGDIPDGIAPVTEEVDASLGADPERG